LKKKINSSIFSSGGKIEIEDSHQNKETTQQHGRRWGGAGLVKKSRKCANKKYMVQYIDYWVKIIS